MSVALKHFILLLHKQIQKLKSITIKKGHDERNSFRKKEKKGCNVVQMLKHVWTISHNSSNLHLKLTGILCGEVLAQFRGFQLPWLRVSGTPPTGTKQSSVNSERIGEKRNMYLHKLAQETNYCRRTTKTAQVVEI